MSNLNFKEQIKQILNERVVGQKAICLVSDLVFGRTAAIKDFADSKSVRLYACLAKFTEEAELNGLPGAKLDNASENENCILLFNGVDEAPEGVISLIKKAIDTGYLGEGKLPDSCLIVITAGFNYELKKLHDLVGQENVYSLNSKSQKQSA